MKKNELLKKLTLQEKAELTTGKDNWSTKEVKALGIPSVRMSDGPNGLRTPKDSDAVLNAESMEAVCFPTACTTGSSFSPELLREIGEELADECNAVGVDVLLGPGVNIKRSPLCGRNFEYFSEDPIVSGEMGASFVQGVQSKGVGCSLKHFCANSQEHRRMDSSSEVDERTLREIYLPAFEKVVKEARPETIMASYNKVNGTYSTENKEILEKILRGEWGYKGTVISDWGATHDRVAAIKAGCDITMPRDAEHTAQIVQAVEDGELTEAELDACVERVISLAGKAGRKEGRFDFARAHTLARKAAEESFVLLKNDGLLPLTKEKRVAFIGTFAKAPHYQGGGSSHVNSHKVTGAYEAALEKGLAVSYAAGCKGIATDERLLEDAISLAKESEVVILFAGLPDIMEQEGNDRRSLSMPESHNTLISEICDVNENTVVVLHNGGPVEMPWVEKPRAILETYLGGEAVGEATVNILFGEVNPSGHLAETFPKKLADTSSYLFYFGEGDKVQYTERFFVGYRYSVSREAEPLFPFGHGLSYTNFTFRELTVEKEECRDTDEICVTVKVKNTGKADGKALVQLYIAPPRKDTIRPVRELKKFKKVFLKAGEEQQVAFILSYRDFAHWEEGFHDWRVESGEYHIQICENAHLVSCEEKLVVNATKQSKPVTYSINMPIKEFMSHPKGKAFVDENIKLLVMGLSYADFLSRDIIEAIQKQGKGEICIKSIEEAIKKPELCSGENFDLTTIFGITLNVFMNFLSEEQKECLEHMIDAFNQ